MSQFSGLKDEQPASSQLHRPMAQDLQSQWTNGEGRLHHQQLWRMTLEVPVGAGRHLMTMAWRLHFAWASSLLRDFARGLKARGDHSDFSQRRSIPTDMFGPKTFFRVLPLKSGLCETRNACHQVADWKYTSFLHPARWLFHIPLFHGFPARTCRIQELKSVCVPWTSKLQAYHQGLGNLCHWSLSKAEASISLGASLRMSPQINSGCH